REALRRWVQRLGSRGAYHKIVHYHGGRTLQKQEAPVKVLGADAPSDFVIRENGVQFTLSFREGHSVGLFLDHRDNRRRLLVILDPPTFSRSKEHGVFQVEKDYGRLVTASLAVLKRGGVLLACTNAALLKAENFIETITTSVRLLRRVISQQHYVPQPPDFPMTREEPGYLKTIWLRVE